MEQLEQAIAALKSAKLKLICIDTLNECEAAIAALEAEDVLPAHKAVQIERGFVKDTHGRIIPIVTMNVSFLPDDWDARDSFAKSIGYSEQQ